MKKNFLILFSLVLLIIILFLPAQFSKESIKNDPKTNLRKRISKTLLEKPKLKDRKKSFDKISAGIKKHDSAEKKITTSLKKEINRSIKQGIKDIRIILNTVGDIDVLINRIKSHGGEVLIKRPDLLGVVLPVNKVAQLIQESSAVSYARLPLKYYPAGEISEGVGLTGTGYLHDSIYKGAGVKIAVIDVGFKGLTGAITAGELPADVIKQDFSNIGLETEYYHGTACAEIVHDMAPEAELHLVKLGDEISGYEVINYCIINNIDIVSLSIGVFGSGPGDGTGSVDEGFDQLRDAGILVVSSAGNYGNYTYEGVTFGSHWEGTFNDSDGDELHEFLNYDPDSFYNVIEAYPDWNDDGEPDTSEVYIVMRWDDWPGSDIDYDMYIYEYDYETGEIVDTEPLTGSANWQTGSQPPVEIISMDIPDNEDYLHYYALAVFREDEETPIGIELEIYLGGTTEFVPFENYSSSISTSSGSIVEPADAESVLAVGAVGYTDWITGPKEEFSSEGPTNDWNGSSARIKPDIMGPDRVTTHTYGESTFYGTSAAAPHVAGMAALVLSMEPDFTADQLQEYLEDASINMGAAGKDNLYGWGRLSIFDKDYDTMPDNWESASGLNPNINDAAGDLDNDDLSNVNEFKNGTDPADQDSDDDGMPDGWEVQYGLKPLVDDAEDDLDGDGFNNLKEYLKKTIPNDPESKPGIGMPWLHLLLGD